MAHQQQPSASPREGFSIARQVMDAVADYFLHDGGPAVARAEVNKLAEVLLKVYVDGWDAYQAALEKIRQAEMAEQQAKEQNRETLEALMKKMASVMPMAQQDGQSARGGVGQGAAAPRDIVLPPKLSTPKAMVLWHRLQQAGIIDECYQPVGLTRTEKAVLAEEMTERLGDENDILLGIREWKPFETLWNTNNMKTDLQRARNQIKTSEFRDKIRPILDGQ